MRRTRSGFALVISTLALCAAARADENPPVKDAPEAQKVEPAPEAPKPPPPATSPSDDDTHADDASETRRDRQVGSPPPPADTGTGFSFGSYGRIGIGTDARGHEGFATNVVSHGSRLEAPPYIELDLYYGGKVGNGRWRAVIAPAFGGDLFHYTGDFASRFALRNGYIETEDLGVKGMRIWAGSRMYRGDDIYLFDYWPLDNLNTVGGGLGWRFGKNDIALQFGMNRQDNPFQYQTQPQPSHGLGPAIPAVVVDRPRFVASAKYIRYLEGRGTSGLKLSAYAELHYVPEGLRPVRDQSRNETLPEDWGYVLGAQIGGWLRPYTFVNLWFRYAGGLAVFGDLGLPSSSPPRSVANARELVGALSLNYETSRIGVMAGAFLRSYRDPDPGALSVRDYVEGALSVRPQIYLLKWLHVATELSYQQRSYAGFDPYLDRRLNPRVFKWSVFPVVAPLGTGTYSRPMIYAIYTLSVLNQDARDALWDPTDVRYGGATQGNLVTHYVGLGAEWWFQSSYR